MEDGDESAAAAALGLSPQHFVNEVHGIIADISAEAFEYCLQAAAATGVVGAATAAEKATDLQRRKMERKMVEQGSRLIRKTASEVLSRSFGWRPLDRRIAGS